MAREALLDAIEALVAQLDAIIVVGAQAIYLHTGSAEVAIAEFTTDGDLALDPDRPTGSPFASQLSNRTGPRASAHAIIPANSDFAWPFGRENTARRARRRRCRVGFRALGRGVCVSKTRWRVTFRSAFMGRGIGASRRAG